MTDFWAPDPEPAKRSTKGYCACPEPLTDSDVNVDSEADDFCWRCGLPVDEAAA